MRRWLPVQGEAQEYVVAFQPVLGMGLMQPLGNEGNVLAARSGARTLFMSLLSIQTATGAAGLDLSCRKWGCETTAEPG